MNDFCEFAFSVLTLLVGRPEGQDCKTVVHACVCACVHAYVNDFCENSYKFGPSSNGCCICDLCHLQYIMLSA